MADVQTWDTSAANNNSASPDGAPEGMAPSGVNDTIRENMAAVARWYEDTNGTLDSGGSSNAYTLTPNGTYSAYARGDHFTFEANHTNTGSATLNVSSLGTKTIKEPDGSTLLANRIVSGGVYSVVYDGTDFLLTSTGPRYGTGTWTCEITDGSTDVTLDSDATYTRVGKLVTCSIIGFNKTITSLSGALSIKTLPFAALANTAAMIHTRGTPDNQPTAIFFDGSTTADLRRQGYAAGGPESLDAADCDSEITVFATFTYEAA